MATPRPNFDVIDGGAGRPAQPWAIEAARALARREFRVILAREEESRRA